MNHSKYFLIGLVTHIMGFSVSGQNCLLDSTYQLSEFNEIAVTYQYDSPADYKTYSTNDRLDITQSVYRETHYEHGLPVYELERLTPLNHQNESFWERDEQLRLVRFKLRNGNENSQYNSWDYHPTCQQIIYSDILLERDLDTVRKQMEWFQIDTHCRIKEVKEIQYEMSDQFSRMDTIYTSLDYIDDNTYIRRRTSTRNRSGSISRDTIIYQVYREETLMEDTVVEYTHSIEVDLLGNRIDSSEVYNVSWGIPNTSSGWINVHQNRSLTIGEYTQNYQVGDTLVIDVFSFNLKSFAGSWKEALTRAQWTERQKYYYDNDSLLTYSEVQRVNEGTLLYPTRKWYFYTKTSSSYALNLRNDQVRVIHQLDPDHVYYNLNGQMIYSANHNSYLIELDLKGKRSRKVLLWR